MPGVVRQSYYPNLVCGWKRLWKRGIRGCIKPCLKFRISSLLLTVPKYV